MTEIKKITGLIGIVSSALFGVASKSRRNTVYLDTDDGRKFVLRRKDGPTFQDQELDQYIGQTISCDGFITGYSLLAEKITVLK